MSWTNDDGTHEGYALPEFSDGVRGRGIWSGSVPHDHVIVDVEYGGDSGSGPGRERYTSRPAAEVVGWRVACDCRTGTNPSAITSTWTSDMIVRVPSRALEDVPAGRIFVPDEDMIGVDDTYFEIFRDLWARLHVNGESALTAITRARHAAATAERELDEAVEAARAAGESWEAIGRAAGIARQSAHARWAPSPGDVAAARRKINAAIAELAAAPLDQRVADEMRRRLKSPDLDDAKAVLRRSDRDRGLKDGV